MTLFRSSFGIVLRINDSFMLLSPHKNLGKRSVVAGQSLAENNYISKSGALGAAVNNFLGSYATQSVQYDVEDPPTGYDTGPGVFRRSEEHTSELQSLMRISYAVFCLKKKTNNKK